jgi:Tol biopolymer transport system component
MVQNFALSPPPAGEGLLAYAAKSGGYWDLFVYDFSARASNPLTRTEKTDEVAPAWSHAGDRLAYVAEQAGQAPQVWVMDRDGGNRRAVTAYAGSNRIWYVAWSSDDRHLIVTVGDGRQAWLSTVPSPTRDVEQLSDFVPPPASHPSVADDGTMVYTNVGAAKADLDLILADASGTAIRTLVASEANEDHPSIDRNGRSVAFNFNNRGSATRRIAVVPASGGEPTPIEAEGFDGDNSNPVWSPDGTSLAIVHNDFSIVIVPLGEGEPELLDLEEVGLTDGELISQRWYLSWTR